MNKLVMLLFSLLFLSTEMFAAAFRIAVPEKLVEKNAILLLYMLDGEGNQSVGKVHLDQRCASRTILQQDMEMTSCDDAALMPTTIDLLNSDVHEDSSIVVCFELDSAIKVVRILVVKDCLLDIDPFDVVSVPFDMFEFDNFCEDTQYDELSSLTATIDDQSAKMLSQQNYNHGSWFDQYVAYAKIFVLMQYGKAQRVVRHATSWWN